MAYKLSLISVKLFPFFQKQGFLFLLVCIEKQMEGEGGAVAVCGDRSLKIGITIWDIGTGEKLLHIPTCASPPCGLLCLKNQYLVASQIHKQGSVAGGAIAMWALNKPQKPLWNYTLEAIGPLSCTKDGIYLAGGALSGKAYLWNVTSGRLHMTWSAHNSSLKCILFSDDDSLLISGSEDGMICVWSMISLLDLEEIGSFPSLLHCLSGHLSSITSFLTTSSNCFSVLVSSSLDGTCKVWDFISGGLMQTQVYPSAVNAIALHQGEGLLFCGTVNGIITVNKLDGGLREDPPSIRADQPLELKGHNGAIIVLTSCQSGLISASEDCTICIWDVINWVIIRRFNLQKGKVTNLAVVMRSSVLSTSNRRRVPNQFIVSSLDKYPQVNNSFKGTTALLSSCDPYKEKQACIDLPSADSLRKQQISDMQKEWTPMAMQMRVETNIENRMRAIKMAKQVMEMNKHLQSKLLDLIERRLCWPISIGIQKTNRKKLKIQNLQQKEEKPQS